MLSYVHKSAGSGMFRGVHAQVCSVRSTCSGMFREEYMLSYVQRGVHAQVCSERSTCSGMFREEFRRVQAQVQLRYVYQNRVIEKIRMIKS